ncbi:flagellar basal body L-ring protein FlgH [Obesumbacterium proteus]|uniref:Flagellar L-ring protein n=1 Tax=Obesumbacterium proteus ATCC 12841 TaxID=1354268 RepID=A0AA91IS49_9GAMM|nr:flagellar basal body L-ring protein FlgH [Obesumbacterium proteus]MCE9886885.1 flagellar basal body L-ring protein FlgH [Obesumbacterium proteus]MCE9918429.1 flagellar basal body L-ring protein FlgH [Obesumbacterium proteus]MCE9928400.1 flagellar basal body L-ring protein FlgH [Obesumbacterium proteus]MCG2875835.1 flagellar basal body L-ring protein FlgH [Obesumbacterium proteus]OAT61166.1 FlgH family flagellar L-ring protein [Obesumbacterium proteus ATCC 12841]
MFIETSDVSYNPTLPHTSGDGRNAIGSFPCKGEGWEGVSSKLIISAALSAALLLSGCAYIPHDQIVKGTTTASPAPAAPPIANGSIFQSVQPMNYGYQPLFEDRRPRNVGDTLTIALQENVSASKSSSANASRNGKSSFEVATTPRYLEGLFGNARADMNMSGDNQFGGKGGANANNTFNGTITVTVAEVLANGNLKVVGEKQIAINQGTEFIRFSGVVNPRTISGSNTVVSTQVADARIEYVGSGYINEAQNMGWLQRFFLNLSPY